ncbi:unnamed protein product [Penicillium salamii]|uniref:Uncharacterized protein n=1 Tax=Penicillium salamii TaxID=1612424 RepID=A0A9W4JEM2_9EURO|nr:unnamed protein product [Penicillium salamii]CAG8386274.1 unnamed protein product [Penicillium salamii]CAG8393771.1 unnamed protein product [Penicillium salamii]CAG8408270.1 unnamed protein product [Penicillium salamii]CAG8418422.1 unnamed protein product [Penicillium salamii]
MSQLSEVYLSSSFETPDGVPLDALQFLLPDDSLSQRKSQSHFQSESQFASTLDLPDNRVQIRVASQAPDTLPRMRPDRINEFIICTPAMSAEFVQWWLHTNYGKSKRINWDISPGSRCAKCWEGFHQVANAKDGKPGVMCNHCCTVLAHPATNHTGTSTMQKHLDGPRCRQRLLEKGNGSIHQLLSNAVSSN